MLRSRCVQARPTYYARNCFRLNLVDISFAKLVSLSYCLYTSLALQCFAMKYLAILLLFSCVAVGTDPPKLGWKKIGEETFSLDAMQHKEFGLPQGRLAFKFKAEEAIYTGVATSQQYAPFRSGKYLELAEF